MNYFAICSLFNKTTTQTHCALFTDTCALCTDTKRFTTVQFVMLTLDKQ